MEKLMVLLLTLSLLGLTHGLLRPKCTKTRDLVSLDGLWHFTLNSSLVDDIEEADDLDINQIPVPSCYNDISTKTEVRDHVGAVWYKKSFYVSNSWSEKLVWIRFGSVSYNASVSINGVKALTHEVGNIPFTTEISSFLNFGEKNTILVEVNNILTNVTIPQGYVTNTSSGQLKQSKTFDSFNYAGIDRSVELYTTNKTTILDVDINTTVSGTSGIVGYNLTIYGSSSNTSYEVRILDKKGNEVVSSTSVSGCVTVQNANFWWPYLMNSTPGYLYTFEVFLYNGTTIIDHYQQPFGIRELSYDNSSFKINGKDLYIRGFSRQEDSEFGGKTVDLSQIIKDHQLLKWAGANCYRTSNGPYSDDVMDLADQLGILIINEVPAINLENYTDTLLKKHKAAFSELYQRDKYRPSVILWSIASEPKSNVTEAEDYFKQLAAYVKSIDTSRPITLTSSQNYDEDYASQFVDIVAINRYQGWKVNVGQTDVIYQNVVNEVTQWRNKHNKTVIFTEYGAESEEGENTFPASPWSEDYEEEVLSEHFRAFDYLRNEGWFVGEVVGNFADCQSDRDTKRVGGKKKGVFSRNRQPKKSAFLLRRRYWSLASKLHNSTVPTDVQRYVVDSTVCYNSTTVYIKEDL